MREATIQKAILNLLKTSGCYAVKVIQASKAGVPDIIACYKGRFIAIEVKTPKTKNNVSELQWHNIELIGNSGGKAIVAWDISGVEKFLKELDETISTSN